MNFQEQFKAFLFNPVLLSCLTSWFCAQMIKTIIALWRKKIKRITELFAFMIWRTGGMPSSHSAFVTSLCTTIAFRQGIDSDLFVVAFCVFMITTRDAFGVRRASGIQAKKINEIGASLSEKEIISYAPIKVVQGHTPIEVITGIALGFLIGLAFSLFK